MTKESQGRWITRTVFVMTCAAAIGIVVDYATTPKTPVPVPKTPAEIIAAGRALRQAGKAPETDAVATIESNAYSCVMNALHNDKVGFADDDWATQTLPGDIYRLYSYVDIPVARGKKDRRGFVAEMWLPGVRDPNDYRVRCHDVRWF